MRHHHSKVEQNEKTMKTIKSLGIVLGLMLAVAFTSCHKDKTGVYVNSITHYSDFDFKADTWVENFTYDNNNRVTRVDNYTNSENITYEYDGDHLKSATVFYRNAIACTWAISYEGDHISKMMGTFYEDFKKDGAKLHLNPLTHLLPPNVCESVNQCEQRLANQRGTKETYTIALLLTWTDNNISKIAFTGDGEYMDFQLQYDDKNCPWYGFMGGLEDYLINFTSGHTGFTKNNVTRIIMTEDDYADTICYAYQYNSEKYPVLQTISNIKRSTI